MEFLFIDATSERILAGYAENLRRLGLAISLRRVDPAQYERRRKSFDFDVVTTRYALRPTPGVELRSYWSSEAAKNDGSANLAGIADPAVDALLAKVIEARSRGELKAAAHALDRVLRAGHYWVPQWHSGRHYVAHWDKYARPADQAALRPRHHRQLVVRCRQGRQAEDQLMRAR